MLVYTVHEPRRTADALDARADALVFVKEGFSLPAALLGPLWLAFNRLWLPLVGYVGAVLALQLFFWLVPVVSGAATAVMVLATLAFGLEANTLLRWGLERRGYQTIGSVAGRTFAECEHRFFTGWIAGRGQGPALTPAASVV